MNDIHQGPRCPRCDHRFEDGGQICLLCGYGTVEAGTSLPGQPPVPLNPQLVANDDLPLLWNRFRVDALLGRGGMGIVYRCTDTLLEGTVVAVKVLPLKPNGGEGTRRLRQEILTARSLSHPSIVRVFDYHADEQQIGFSMEFLGGATLAEHLSGHVAGSPFCDEHAPGRLDAVARMAEGLASALDHIHGTGYVHRDVKPSNVLLTGPAVRPTGLKLLDFGIVHVGLNSGLTRMAQPGTMDYMAPELLHRETPTRAADIYSFGKLLYHALTGVNPQVVLGMSGPSALVEGLPRRIDGPILDCFGRKEVRPTSASILVDEILAALDDVDPEHDAGGGEPSTEDAEPTAGAHAEPGAPESSSVSPDPETLRETHSDVQPDARFTSSSEPAAVEITWAPRGDWYECMSASNDGRFVAIKWHSRVFLLDARTGSVIRELFAPDSAMDLSFSPDGDHLAALLYGDTGLVWDVRTGDVAYTLQDVHDKLEALSLGSHPSRFVTLEGRRHVCIRELATGEVVRTLESPADLVGTDIAVFLSRDGARVAAGPNPIVYWDLSVSDEPRLITEQVKHFALSPNGHDLALGTEGTAIKIVEARTGTLDAHLRCGADTIPAEEASFIQSLRFSSDGRQLAVRRSGLVWVWDLEHPSSPKQLLYPYCHGTRVAFSESDTFALVGGKDHAIGKWDIATETLVAEFAGVLGTPPRCCASPTSLEVAVSAGSSTGVWDGQSGTFTVVCEHDDVLNAVSFGPRDARIVGVSSSQRIVAGSDGRRVEDLPENVGPPVVFSPDRRHIAYRRGYQTIAVMDVLERECLFSVGDDGWISEQAKSWLPGGIARSMASGHHGNISCLAYHPDGTSIASGEGPVDHVSWEHYKHFKSYDVCLWNTRSRKQIRALRGHPDKVTALTFSRDGRWLATGCKDGSIRIWDPKSGALLSKLNLIGAPVSTTAFHPGGKILATNASGGGFCFWSMPDGEPRHQVVSTLPITDLQFSADGQFLFTVYLDGSVELWTDLLGTPAKVATLLMSDAAWAAFTPDGFYDANDTGLDLISVSDGERAVPARECPARRRNPLLGTTSAASS